MRQHGPDLTRRSVVDIARVASRACAAGRERERQQEALRKHVGDATGNFELLTLAAPLAHRVLDNPAGDGRTMRACAWNALSRESLVNMLEFLRVVFF